MSFGRRLLCLGAVLLGVATLGLCLGSTSLWSLDSRMAGLILLQIRLPRVAAGILAGVGLSASGVLLQCVTANPMAGPNIIGINSGAGLGTIVMLSLFPAAGGWLSGGAFAGAFAAALVIVAISGRLGSSRTVIVLIGIAVTTLLNAAISFLSLLDEDVLAEYNHFTLGSLKGAAPGQLIVPGVLILGCFVVAMVMAPRLKILCLGDSTAAALGVRVKRLRLAAMACAAGCAAAVVSFAGLLGFVGLVVPHIAQRLVGQDPGKMLPTAALTGGIVVVLADLLGRTLAAPSELPVGILMSVVGAPYFLLLLVRRRGYADI